MTGKHKARPRVLWVDDDGPGRFELECAIIEQDFGADLDWAETLEVAVRLLRDNAYDAIILDQMLADPDAATPHVPWAGCALFLWLRGDKSKPWGSDWVWPSLRGTSPNPANANTPVLFVSGLSDEQIWTATRSVDLHVELLSKPLNDKQLVSFLQKAFADDARREAAL